MLAKKVISQQSQMPSQVPSISVADEILKFKNLVQ